MTGKLRTTLLTAAFATTACGLAAADGPTASISSNGISVGNTAGMNSTMLTVKGPEGYYVQQFQKAGAPSASLSGLSDLPDGTYNYEITASTNAQVAVTDKLDNGRGPDARSMMSKGVTSSGSFTVRGGKIVTDTDAKE